MAPSSSKVFISVPPRRLTARLFDDVQTSLSYGDLRSAFSPFRMLTLSVAVNCHKSSLWRIGSKVDSLGSHPSVARSGTATIAGQTFTVNRAAGTPPSGCTYEFDPPSLAVWGEAYSGTVRVITGATCARTAVSQASWIRVTSGASGNGAGQVGFAVVANPDALVRDGVVRIGTADFLIKQAAGQAGPVISSGGGERGRLHGEPFSGDDDRDFRH